MAISSVGYLGHEDTRSISSKAATISTAENILKKLYRMPEYGNYKKEQAEALAMEWETASRKIAEKVSERLQGHVQKTSGRPFAHAAITEAMESKSPFLRENGKTFLNFGWGIDVSPKWNSETRVFDVALSEAQVWPQIENLLQRSPEIRKKITGIFNNFSASRQKRI